MIPTARRSLRAVGALCALGLASLPGCSGAEPEELVPSTVTVTPGSASFDAVGKTRSFVAAVTDQNGDPLPSTPVTWSSSASDVATVDALGVVTAVSNGTAFIRASAGSTSGSASVVVEQAATGLESAGGDAQTGSAGTVLPAPLRVRAVDARGNPAEGVAVRFQVTEGNGDLSAVNAVSDAQGVAETLWTLGTVAGAGQGVEASVPGSALGAVRFEAQAVPGPAAVIDVLAGTAQSAGRASTLPTDIQVRVTDDFGNPIPGARVDFEAATGGGGADPAQVQADGEGRATTTWTLGTVLGTQTLRASSGEASATVEAIATVVPAAVIVSAGDAQTATVDESVATAPAVRVTDAQALPAPGVEVTFTVTGGGGSIAAPSSGASNPGRVGTPARTAASAVTEVSVVTDDDGSAAVGSWTLGQVAGSNTLVAEVQGLAPVSFTATGTPGAPATLAKVEGDGQTGPISTTLPLDLVVQMEDGFGNPVPDARVDFAVTGGGGEVSAGAATTGGDGRARASWSLGPAQGEQTVSAQGAGGTVVFTATATAIPGAMTVQAGSGQTATVGTSVPTPPAVRVTTAGGAPVPGAVVSFTVSAGDGVVSGGGVTGGSVEVQTGADGIAALEAWTLGTVAGSLNQALEASTAGLDGVSFTATAVADDPAVFAKVSGEGQSGEVGTTLGEPVVVEVTDRFGNPVAGVAVSFSVSQGSVDPGADLTDGAGRASTVWSLGPDDGTQLLSAFIGAGIDDLIFSATATAPVFVPECTPAAVQAGFDIQLCYLTEVSASVQSAFDDAAARWGQLITGDVPDITTTVGSGSCGSGNPEVSGTFDDLIIFVTVEPIDGEFNILGSAGPCAVRFGDPSTRLPFAGRMRFDEADMDRLEADGDLEAVILHEMGHVLGIGTLWSTGPYDFLQNPVNGSPNPSADTHFNGPLAIAAFDAAGGAGRTVDSKVPVENAQGGGGTLDSHWRESTLDTELMTGFLDGGSGNPLSAITVASLGDLGYQVDTGAADAYTVAAPNGVPALESGRREIELVGDVLRLPIYLVDADGKVVGVIRH